MLLNLTVLCCFIFCFAFRLKVVFVRCLVFERWFLNFPCRGCQLLLFCSWIRPVCSKTHLFCTHNLHTSCRPNSYGGMIKLPQGIWHTGTDFG